MGLNHFWMFVTFQYRGLYHLDMYCTLIIQAWLKSNIHFGCRYLELWNACIISLVFIVLNVRDGNKSKYLQLFFLSIFSVFLGLWFWYSANESIKSVWKRCPVGLINQHCFNFKTQILATACNKADLVVCDSIHSCSQPFSYWWIYPNTLLQKVWVVLFVF